MSQVERPIFDPQNFTYALQIIHIFNNTTLFLKMLKAHQINPLNIYKKNNFK
jgi:hypothetical protein